MPPKTKIDLKGKSVALIGTLRTKRGDVTRLATAAGAKIVAMVSKKVDLVVEGQKAAGTKKADEAKSLKIPFICEEIFLAAVGSGENVAKKAERGERSSGTGADGPRTKKKRGEDNPDEGKSATPATKPGGLSSLGLKGTIVCAGLFSKSIIAYDAKSGATVREVQLRGRGVNISSTSVAPDASRRVAAQGTDGLLRVYDFTSEKTAAAPPLVLAQEAKGERVWQVAWSPDGSRIATVGDTSAMRVWDVGSGTCVATVHPPGDDFGGRFSWSASGEWMAVTNSSPDPQIVCVRTSEEVRRLSGHEKWCKDIVFGPSFLNEGRLVATASLDHTAKVWDATTGRCLATLRAENQTVSLAWGPVAESPRLAVGSEDKSVRIYDAVTWRCLHTIPDPKIAWPHSLAWSLDGRYLAAACLRKELRIIDANAGAIVGTLDHSKQSFGEVVWTAWE